MMENTKKRAKVLWSAAVAIYVLSVSYAVLSKRAFYADGSNFFLNLLNNQNNHWPFFDAPRVNRLFVNLLSQLPASLAMKVGVRSIPVLRFMWAFPLFCVNIAGLFLTRRITKKMEQEHLILYPLIGFSFYNILSELFVENSSITAYWIFLLLFLYAISEFQFSKADWLLAVICSLVGFRAHEGILIFGPMIAAGALCKIVLLFRQRKVIDFKTIAILCIVILQTFYCVHYRVLYPAGELTGNYLRISEWLFHPEFILFSNLGISYAGTLLCLAAIKRNISLRATLLLLMLAVLWPCLLQFLFSGYVNPLLQYKFRTLITLNEIVVFGLIFFDYYFKFSKKIHADYASVLIGAAIVWISQSCYQIGNTVHWNQYLSEFTASLQEADENTVILNDTIPYSSVASRYEWPWCPPNLSLAVSDSYVVKKLVLPSTAEYGMPLLTAEGELFVPYVELNPSIFHYKDFVAQNAEQLGKQE